MPSPSRVSSILDVGMNPSTTVHDTKEPEGARTNEHPSLWAWAARMGYVLESCIDWDTGFFMGELGGMYFGPGAERWIISSRISLLIHHDHSPHALLELRGRERRDLLELSSQSFVLPIKLELINR
ncbi:hypothetical protein AB1N83_011797 [Pleurotus pulmonarius]